MEISGYWSSGRQSEGGKSIFQNPGAGESNSRGTWKPSGVSRGGRATLQPTRSLCAAMLDHKMGFGWKALFHHHHRAVGSYAQRGRVDGCRDIL